MTDPSRVKLWFVRFLMAAVTGSFASYCLGADLSVRTGAAGQPGTKLGVGTALREKKSRAVVQPASASLPNKPKQITDPGTNGGPAK